MSGKYKKKTAKHNQTSAAKSRRKNNSAIGLKVCILVILLLALVAAVAFLIEMKRNKDSEITETSVQGTQPASAENAATENTQPSQPESGPVANIQAEPVSVNLGYGLQMDDVGSYTGIYMEDGTDELVSGVLMMIVTNTGEQSIQYAQITMTQDDWTAEFSLTTLGPGQSVVLLEQNRMEYSDDVDYSAAFATAANVAYFTEEPSLHADKLDIQILDGAINVTNISGEDIAGDIVIYYKNAADDIYYGGITYRIRLEGGLQADEIRQLMANHFSETGSEIMFVTIAE